MLVLMGRKPRKLMKMAPYAAIGHDAKSFYFSVQCNFYLAFSILAGVAKRHECLASSRFYPYKLGKRDGTALCLGFFHVLMFTSEWKLLSTYVEEFAPGEVKV